MRDVDGAEELLRDGFTRYLVADILHGTDHVAQEIVESWSLPGDITRDPKTTGRVRFAHVSVAGESWVPRGARGVLSPHRATLLLTEVISAGTFERRIQLGRFDVVAVPYAQDVTATVGARWVEDTVAVGDEFPVSDAFPPGDGFPGEMQYAGGSLVGGYEIVVASIVEVEVESLDGRALRASLRSPRTSLTSAWGEWRAVGILPVQQTGDDVEVTAATWPAEDGSRLDAIQAMARALGGVPLVDSAGQWVLAGADTPVVELQLGEHGTVVDLASELSLDEFANVIVGDFEDEAGNALRAEWVASGLLSPEAMGREIVRFVTSDTVRTEAQATAYVAAEGLRATSQEVDVQIVCVYNPLIELGDHVTIPGENETGVIRRLNPSDAATMTVVARVRRALL